eukprot:g73188.t1
MILAGKAMLEKIGSADNYCEAAAGTEIKISDLLEQDIVRLMFFLKTVLLQVVLTSFRRNHRSRQLTD